MRTRSTRSTRSSSRTHSRRSNTSGSRSHISSRHRRWQLLGEQHLIRRRRPSSRRLRQRRQYVDSLWVKGLTGLAMTYLAGVFVYLAVLTFQESSVDTLRDETRAMALQYTNTL